MKQSRTNSASLSGTRRKVAHPCGEESDRPEDRGTEVAGRDQKWRRAEKLLPVRSGKHLSLERTRVQRRRRRSTRQRLQGDHGIAGCPRPSAKVIIAKNLLLSAYELCTFRPAVKTCSRRTLCERAVYSRAKRIPYRGVRSESNGDRRQRSKDDSRCETQFDD